MESTLEKFGHFLIARRADGTNVELQRSSQEVVFLAFDTKIHRLVELHVLKAGAAMDATEKRSAFERCKMATEVRGLSFMRVLEAGEENNVLYYSGNLTDGEFAADYVSRRGPLPAVTAFCLMQQFLEDLLAIQKFERLVSRMKLSNPLVTMQEDTFLQLRVVDYGMSDREVLGDSGMRGVVADCCHLLFLLLTGNPFDGQNPDRFPALTCLPTNLRSHMRAALVDPDQASPSLSKLRDDVKEAYSALVSSLQVRTSRKHIVITEALQPQSQLQELLLEHVPVEDLLKGRFSLANGDDVRRYPFSIPAINVKTEQAVTVHLLPPSRVVERSQYEAVPLQMWRFNPERHPNIVRSLSLWENPDWTFLTEEREPGFALSRLMAERITLNPPEVLVLLRQVRAGLDQAMECGVRHVDLHPSNLLLRVGTGGVMQSREFERLMQKRIDAWPPFLLKLRTHMTMRSLYEPLLVEPIVGSEHRDSHLVERDMRNRSFVGLAVYLLTGERQIGNVPTFGEAVPEAVATLLRECQEAGRIADRTPSPSDFLTAFEQRMEQQGPEGRGIAAIMAASGTFAGEVESAGAISDFDEDWSDDNSSAGSAPSYLVASGNRKSLGLASIPQHRQGTPGSAGMLIWAAAAIILLVAGWFVFSGGNKTPAAAPSVTTQAHAPATVASQTSHSVVTTTPPSELPKPSAAPVVPAPAEILEGPITIKKAIVPTASEVGTAKQERSTEAARAKPPSSSVVVDGHGGSVH